MAPATHALDASRTPPRSFAAMSRTAKNRPTGPGAAPNSLRFSAINGILLVAGLAAITAGYWMLSRGSTVGAPLLLVLGYAVLLPLAIIL